MGGLQDSSKVQSSGFKVQCEFLGGNVQKIFDLLERCKNFASDVFALLEKVPKKSQNIRIADQLYRCAASVGANYNEATDSLGKRDRLMKLRTSRREASESKYFLDLLNCPADIVGEQQRLSQEARELTNILSSMIVKTEDQLLDEKTAKRKQQK